MKSVFLESMLKVSIVERFALRKVLNNFFISWGSILFISAKRETYEIKWGVKCLYKNQ
jgi:hypothetical protein